MEPTTADPLDPLLSRRTVLRGSAALGLLGALGVGLAGCGGDDGDDDTAGGDTADEATESERVLVMMTNAAATQAAGEPGRIPLGIGDSTGALVLDGPATLSLTVEDAQSGEVVQQAIEVTRRDSGLERAYYPLTFTAPAAGFYKAVGEVDGQPVDAAFEVRTPEQIVIPRPGQPLPPTPTPTTDDARGVDPICTNDPPCALHATDLEDVLGASPVAVLVATPAFCTTAICGPVLDLFVAAGEAHPEVTFIHVEPYASGEAVMAEGPSPENLSPAVEAWQLPFEPCLLLVAADGTVTARLDVIYDADELDEALARLQA